MPPPPMVFALMAAFWGLTPAEEKRLWQALARATWSLVVSWRQQLLLYDETRAQLPAARVLLHQTCAPVEVLGVLEHLAREGVLTRRTVAAYEERILTAVDAEGHWCDHPMPAAARPAHDRC